MHSIQWADAGVHFFSGFRASAVLFGGLDPYFSQAKKNDMAVDVLGECAFEYVYVACVGGISFHKNEGFFVLTLCSSEYNLTPSIPHLLQDTAQFQPNATTLARPRSRIPSPRV